jgi:hypothetical protein
MLTILAEDDEHLNDFDEYMPGDSCLIRTRSYGLP